MCCVVCYADRTGAENESILAQPTCGTKNQRLRSEEPLCQRRRRSRTVSCQLRRGANGFAVRHKRVIALSKPPQLLSQTSSTASGRSRPPPLRRHILHPVLLLRAGQVSFVTGDVLKGLLHPRTPINPPAQKVACVHPLITQRVRSIRPTPCFFQPGIDPGLQFHLPPVFRSRPCGPT